MFQLKHQHRQKSFHSLILRSVIPIGICIGMCYAQGYDDAFELKSKLKVEFQYADYGEYEYPEPVLFQYGVTPHIQNKPYIADFPEKRLLIKFSRLIGSASALSMKYQYSDLREDAKQHFGELKYTKSFNESVVGIVSGQILNDTRQYTAYQGGAGCLWEISPITSTEVDLQYFYRGSSAKAVGGKMGMFNARLKYRQVLTISTAFLAEYIYYNALGDAVTFNSHSIACWLSQYLPTETAVHLNLRYYRNSMGISSVSPSVEIYQYIDWATIIMLKYRHYKNESDNVSLGEKEIIIPNGLSSNSYSVQLNREISSALLLYAKYRYYKSNMNVQMNTYLMGFVYSF